MSEGKLTGCPSIDKPWLKYYSDEAIHASLPEGTICSFMMSRNQDRLDAAALNYFGRKTSYRALFQEIDRAAASLAALGVKRGDVVSICMPNMPESVIAFYAVNRIGAVACMLNPMNSEREIEHDLSETGSKVLFLVSPCLPKLETAISRSSLSAVVLVSPADSMPLPMRIGYRLAKERGAAHGPRCICWKKFARLGSGAVSPAGETQSPAVILHTGGTTGEPKGVLFSNLAFNSLVCEEQFPSEYSEHYCSSIGDTLWPIVPLFYGYGLCVGIHVTLCYGMTVLLIPQPDVKKVYETVSKYRPNHIFGIPSYLEAMADEPRFHGMDLSFFKYIVTGGDSMSIDLENRINDFLAAHGASVRLVKGYGMTEMVATATLTLPNCNEVGSVGVPMSMTNLKIVEPGTENELRYNETGEICFSSPTLMMGYYHDPAETAKIIRTHADGQRWACSGDLGCVTENGTLYHRGRLKRIMITYYGPEHTPQKLFPDRIENTLTAHPAVSACAVVSLPHPEAVNVAKAYLLLQSGFSASEALLSELQTYCAENLPAYSVPFALEFIDAFPRTKAGKVDYLALEKMANTHAESSIQDGK